MTEAGIARVLATVDFNPYISHSPGALQALFLSLVCREAIYGGAAGGGKTDALLMAALQYVEEPKYYALILMRSFADLNKADALIPRSQEWLQGTPARWVGQRHRWYFPSGASLEFGYMDTEQDKYKYKGPQFDFIGWDQVENFTESQYRYMFSRMRRLRESTVPPRMRSTANPEEPGYRWVKQRFIIEGVEKNRPFVPARLEDNPFIDQEEYNKNLGELDPLTRERLQHGDWSVQPSGIMFKRHWFDVVDVIPESIYTIRFWDMAATEVKPGKDPDYTVGTRIKYHKGHFYVDDVVAIRENPGAVRRVIGQCAVIDGPDTLIFMEQEPGSSGKITVDDYATTTLSGYAFRGIPSTGSKTTRATPFAIAAEQDLVHLKRAVWNTEFLDQAVVFGSSDALHDDHIDSAAGAYNEARKIARVSFGRL